MLVRALRASHDLPVICISPLVFLFVMALVRVSLCIDSCEQHGNVITRATQCCSRQCEEENLLASITTFYTSLLIFPRCEAEAVGITEI